MNVEFCEDNSGFVIFQVLYIRLTYTLRFVGPIWPKFYKVMTDNGHEDKYRSDFPNRVDFHPPEGNEIWPTNRCV